MPADEKIDRRHCVIGDSGPPFPAMTRFGLLHDEVAHREIADRKPGSASGPCGQPIYRQRHAKRAPV